jgi:hypothetical protein
MFSWFVSLLVFVSLFPCFLVFSRLLPTEVESSKPTDVQSLLQVSNFVNSLFSLSEIGCRLSRPFFAFNPALATAFRAMLCCRKRRKTGGWSPSVGLRQPSSAG